MGYPWLRQHAVTAHRTEFCPRQAVNFSQGVPVAQLTEDAVRRIGQILALMLCIVCWRSVALSAEQRIKLTVTLRPSVTSDVMVTVHNNPSDGRCFGQTLLTVHGLAHTAATWNPFIDELFSTQGGQLFCRVVTVDLPGHGLSALPQGTNFGSLLIDDYITALQGVLDGLRSYHIVPTALIGHSMGGLIVEGLQAKLLTQGSSLAHQYRIYWVLLLSPVYAREQAWALADSGQAVQILSPFIVADPIKGMVVRFDIPVWQPFFFTNFSQQLAPSAPSISDIVQYGYASDEAFAAGAELIGAAPLQRLSVGTTPFALRHGTLLFWVNPSQDVFNLRSEAQAAYVQLTGDAGLHGFIPVDAPYAVHDLYLGQPALILQSIQTALIPGKG